MCETPQNLRQRTSVWNLFARFAPVVAVVCISLLRAAHLPAQDDTKEPEEKPKIDLPLATINCAGVERILGNVDYLFAAAERVEFAELVAAQLANVRDLKGIDRSKAFGLMIFMEPGLAPQPVPIGYVPVADVDELMQTVSIGPLHMRRAGGEDGFYEIVSPRTTLYALMQHGYLFISNDEDALDRNFPNPVKVTESLSNRFDIAASLNLNNVPEGMKSLFLDFLRASANAELQQRDNESDARFRIRKANGDSTLEWIDLLLTDGESLMIGLDVAQTEKIAAIEISVAATPDSKFAKRLSDTAGRSSRYTSLLDRTVPLTFSTSWSLGGLSKNTLDEVISAAESQLASVLSQEAQQQLTPASKGMFDSLRETAAAGHVDMFAQFSGVPPEKFVLIGGLTLSKADLFAQSLSQVLLRLKSNPNIAELDLNVSSHAGIAFHRLLGSKIRKRDEQLYGEQPSLYVGAASRTLWFAVGGEQALPTLYAAIDQVAQAKPAGVSGRMHAPFQLTIHILSWIEMMLANSPSDFLEAAREAFTKDDFLQVDFRPTNSGARFRIQFDEGFVRLMGMSIARRLDRRFNAAP